MTKRKAFGAAIAVAALTTTGLCAAGGAAAEPPAPKPNIITIVTDDLGYADTSLLGGAIDTPAIANLAASGVTYAQGFTASPVCAPSRLGLMSGRNPSEMQADSLLDAREFTPDIAGSPDRWETIPQVLGDDYTRKAIGKWDMSGQRFQRQVLQQGDRPNLPDAMGFESYFGMLAGAGRYCAGKGGATYEYDAATTSYHPVDNPQYLTTEFTDRAVQAVKDQEGRDKPLYLYLAYNAPHNPYQTKESCQDPDDPGPQTDAERIARFTEMVGDVDDGVRRIQAALKATGQADNTMITFVSDNGPEHVDWLQTGDLRGGKYTLYEGGIRVPFVVSWPGRLPEGTVSRRPVSTLDLLPTYAVAAQSDISGVGYPGRDLTADDQPEPYVHFWRYDSDSRGDLNAGGWNLPPGSSQVVGRSGPCKYVRVVTPNGAMTESLFDLDTPGGLTEQSAVGDCRGLSLAQVRKGFRGWAARIPTHDDFSVSTAKTAGKPYGFAMLGGTWNAAQPDGQPNGWKFEGTSTGEDAYALDAGTWFGDRVAVTAELDQGSRARSGVVISAHLGKDRQVESGYAVDLDRAAGTVAISRIADSKRTVVKTVKIKNVGAGTLQVTRRGGMITVQTGGARASWNDRTPLAGGSVGLHVDAGTTHFHRLDATPR